MDAEKEKRFRFQLQFEQEQARQTSTKEPEKFIEPAAAKEAAKQVGKMVLNRPLNILKDTAGLALGSMEQVKQGVYDIPKAIAKAPAELANTVVNNTSPNLSILKHAEEGTQSMAQGISNAVQHPLDTINKHPVSTALALQGAKGLGKTAFDLTGLKTALKNVGARQVARDIGLQSEATLKTILKKGETGEAGVLRMAQTLSDDGILKGTANESAVAFKAKQAELGKINQELKKRIGKESFIDNANEALNPIREMIAKADNASTAEAKALGKTPKEIYNGLIKDSERAGNKITLDAIDKKLDEVGNLITKGSPEKQANNRSLYGKLAQIRDQIVTETAKGIGDPKLRQEYLKNNEQYSFYKRLEVAISKEALSEALGKRSKYSIFEPRESLKNFFGKLTAKALEKSKKADMKGLVALGDNETLRKLQNKYAK